MLYDYDMAESYWNDAGLPYYFSKDNPRYGSYSKGGYTEESDIDIAVIVSHRSDDYFSEVPLLWTLKREVSNLIEPVLLTEGEDSPLYQDIMKTGIRI